MLTTNQSNPALGATTGTNFSNFSFGPQTTASAFGAASATKPAFGTSGFGTTNTFSGFGNPTTTTGFGFGSTPAATTMTTTPFFGGTNISSSTGFGGFGNTSITSTAPTFKGFGSVTASTGSGLGTSFGGFGSTFGKPPAQQLNFGGFGTGAFGLQQQQQQPTTGFQLPLQLMSQQQQQQQQQQLSPDEALGCAFFYVNLFNNENDTIIANWNYFQAMWGTGKAFYANNTPPIDITSDNYFCRFKAIAYSHIPGKDNKLGHVLIMFNKPYNDVKNQQQQIIQNLNQILGNKQNLIINIENIQQHDEKTQLTISIDEKSLTNPNDTRRILATEVNSYLNQQQFNMQLTNMNVEYIIPIVLPDTDELEKYLNTPPLGIDLRMWKQAKLDNPNPKLFIPIPIVGFKQLKKRVELQEQETDLHALYLMKIGKDITDLKQRHATSIAKIRELKRNLILLNHNLLEIAVEQECTRKMNIAITPEEELLRNKLECMNSLLLPPVSLKGRLQELLSYVRLQKHQISLNLTTSTTCALEKGAEDNLKSFLVAQQRAIEFLINIINRDMNILQRIQNEVSLFKLPEDFDNE